MEEEFIFFEFGKFRGIFRAVNLALKFDSFDIYGNIDRLFLTSDFSIPSLSKLLGFKWMEFFEFGKGGELLKLFGGRSRVNLRAYRSNQIRNREIIRGRE